MLCCLFFVFVFPHVFCSPVFFKTLSLFVGSLFLVDMVTHFIFLCCRLLLIYFLFCCHWSFVDIFCLLYLTSIIAVTYATWRVYWLPFTAFLGGGGGRRYTATTSFCEPLISLSSWFLVYLSLCLSCSHLVSLFFSFSIVLFLAKTYFASVRARIHKTVLTDCKQV